MGAQQFKKSVQDLELINQLIKNDILNGKAGVYILPVLTKKIEIATSLFGLKYTFEQLSLHDANVSENEQLFFWVRQPKDCEDSLFNQNILKICHHYQITLKCAVSIQNTDLKIKLYVNKESSKSTVEVKEAAEWLMSSFFEKFKNKSLETFVLTHANESSAVAEPQTNMGRMARKLKADQLVQQIDLTKTI